MNDIFFTIPATAARHDPQQRMHTENKPKSKRGDSDFEKLFSDILRKGKH